MRQLELYYDDNHHIVHSVLRDLSQSESGTACEVDANCYQTDYFYDGDLLVEAVYSDDNFATYDYDDLGRMVYRNDPRAHLSPQLCISLMMKPDWRLRSILMGSVNCGEKSKHHASTRMMPAETVTLADDLGNTSEYTYTWLRLIH